MKLLVWTRSSHRSFGAALPATVPVGHPEAGVLHPALITNIDPYHRSSSLAREVERHFCGEEPRAKALRPAGPHASLLGRQLRNPAQVLWHCRRKTDLVGIFRYELRAHDQSLQQALDVRR